MQRHSLLVSALFTAIVLAGCAARPTVPAPAAAPQPAVAPAAQPALTPAASPAPKSAEPPLWEKYRDLRVIDVHNHDADNVHRSLALWDRYGIDRTVIFGAISEPSAVLSDQSSWKAYRDYTDKLFPLFSGFNLGEKGALDVVRQKLEAGYYGLGEVVAASYYSHILSQAAWKGQNAMDGYLPDIYKLIATYKAPILLHIDPIDDKQMRKLEQALTESPDTMIILGHGNVGGGPDDFERLLAAHANLYIDFFAGYTAYGPKGWQLADYTPVIEKYPDHFFVSTDSGTGVTYDEALKGIYDLLDKLRPETRERVAHANFDRIIEAQPATQTQLARLRELGKAVGEAVDTSKLNKRAANEAIFRLEAKVPKKG